MRLHLQAPRGVLGGLALASLVAIADQLSKLWALDFVKRAGGEFVVLPFFRLVSVWNRGVSFGFLSNVDAAKFLIWFTVAAIVALLLWLNRARRRLVPGAIGLIIGGATGNLFDRLRYGAVADFLDFHVAGWHWPAFNLADSAIVLGVLLLVLDSFLPADAAPVGKLYDDREAKALRRWRSSQ